MTLPFVKITLKRVFLFPLIIVATSTLLLSFANKFITHPLLCDLAQLPISSAKLTRTTNSSTQITATAGPDRQFVEGTGFMLAFGFWEQQTQGLNNFLELQCLASSVGMRVVEPFLVKSMLSFPFGRFSQLNDSNAFLKLGGLIDMDYWNRKTSTQYLPVSTWDHFLKEASRDIIISCIRYRSLPVIKVPEPGFNFREGCSKSCYKQFDNSLNFLARFGFRLVRSTCSNFVDFGGSVSVNTFNENLFGKHNPRNVTVLLNDFRGLFGLYRMPLKSTCGFKSLLPAMPVIPSSRIFEDLRKYSDSVLKGKPYISVVARIERVVLHLKHDMEVCSQEVSEILQSTKPKKEFSNVFLAMDVGKFGSNGANLAHLQPKGQILFNAIYGAEQWTFNEWEDTFSRILDNDTPAYVANLQRTLAAKAECLIMVGGGSFQEQALRWYEKFHPDISDQCVFRVCTEHNH